MNSDQPESTHGDVGREPRPAEGELASAPKPRVDEASHAENWHGYDHSYDASVQRDRPTRR